MEGKGTVGRENMGNGNDEIAGLLCPFYLAVPFSWIFTIGSDEFLHGKAFITAMPAYNRIRAEKRSNIIGSLLQNGAHKGMNLHIVHLSV